MHKIGLIIAREYKSRVKKKSFIIMSILGPFVFAALFVVPIWLATRTTEEAKLIRVLDETGLFSETLKSNKKIYFDFVEGDLTTAKNRLKKDNVFGLLYIPEMSLGQTKTIKLYSSQNPAITIVSSLRWQLQSRIEDMRLKQSGVDAELLKGLKKKIDLQTINLSKSGSETKSNVAVTTGVGYVSAFLIYFFIFLYGAQIMRGVIEEKTSRIIEVIIASVKPIELMVGKVIGVAGVGLTQFLIWVLLSFGLISGASAILFYGTDQTGLNKQILEQKTPPSIEYEVAFESIEALSTIDFTLILTCFVVYFIGGYLFYAALFAAIGSAVDSDADTQQFMLPITAPLIFSMVMMTAVLRDPNSTLSFWLSIIPFTSPVIMMMRLPFEVPFWQIVLSIISLCLGFVATTWFASKIYRIGIFVHGTKVNYKTLWNWLFTNY